MRRLSTWISLFGLMVLAGCSARPGPEELSLHRDVTSAQGWHGRATFLNGRLVAEEYDAMGRDGRYDLWRYYEAGRILSEKRDRDADDRIDYEASYEPSDGRLSAFERDTNFDGRMDLWVRFREEGFWVETRDTDHDGEPDRFFAFNAPPELLTSGAVDPLEAVDLQETLPPAQWGELVADTDTDGTLDQWVRYENGAPYQVGVDTDGDGRPERWNEVGRPAAAGDDVPEIGGSGRAEAPAPPGGDVIPAEPDPEPVVIKPVVIPEGVSVATAEPADAEPADAEPADAEPVRQAETGEPVEVEPVQPLEPVAVEPVEPLEEEPVRPAGPAEPFRHPSEGLME